MLYKLVRDTDRSKIASRVVCLVDGGSVAGIIRDLGIPVTGLGMRPGIPDPRGLWRLLSVLRRWRPDVLQTWLYHADLMGLVAGRLAGVPAIGWNVRCSAADALHLSGRSGWTVRTLARLSRLPAVVVANSQAGIEFHRGLGYHPKRWEMIPNGFDLAQFRPDPELRRAVRAELGIVDETPLIGLIARFDPLKDHVTFLRAASLLVQRAPNAHFVLAGTGVDSGNARLSALVADLNLAAHVHLLGERTDIARLTSALDVATCSSSAEGFPNVIGEAMACAVPVAATDVGDARTVIGDTGVVVQPGDPGLLAGAWHQLLGYTPERRAELGRRARERIALNYEIRTIARRYEKLYAELVTPTSAGV